MEMNNDIINFNLSINPFKAAIKAVTNCQTAWADSHLIIF